MNQKTMNAIRAHAESCYPRECCGLVIAVRRKERYVPCENTAVGEEHFAISAEAYANAEESGNVIAVVHSHPNMPAQPSEADLVSCEESGLPWHIIRVDLIDGKPVAGEVNTIEPSGYQAPLVGRQFFHGVLDCYALIRDWYQIERGITLPDFNRSDEWWNDGQSDLYTQGFPLAGFEIRPHDQEPQPGDVILMQIRSKNGVPNHAAIYLGDGLILHHLHGRLSSRDVYGGYWQEVTRSVLKYRGNNGSSENDTAVWQAGE